MERVASRAVGSLQGCLRFYRRVFRHAKNASLICFNTDIQLQVLGSRVDHIWRLYKERELGLLQLLCVLFMLALRGKLFKRNRLAGWHTLGLTQRNDAASAIQLPAYVQVCVLRHLTPLLAALLGEALRERQGLLDGCYELVADFCDDADVPAAPAWPSASIRVPRCVRALVLDLDDTLWLHSHIHALRELYWTLAQPDAAGGLHGRAAGAPGGAHEALLREVVMQAVPHRQFLVDLVDSCRRSGTSVFVASFGLRAWVAPVVRLLFGDALPASHVYCLDGHPPRVPAVLNKNLWLGEVSERAGCLPHEVLLVDDQASNIARALVAGFSALKVSPESGLHYQLWRDKVCSMEAWRRRCPPLRVRAYCPADNATFVCWGGGQPCADACQRPCGCPDPQPPAGTDAPQAACQRGGTGGGDGCEGEEGAQVQEEEEEVRGARAAYSVG